MKKYPSKGMLGFGLVMILFTVLACGVGAPTAPQPTETPILPPTETSQPTATLPPLYLSVNLQTTPVTEESTTPKYTVEAQVPVLQGSSDPRAINFNNEMALLVQEEIGLFKDNVRALGGYSSGGGSSFHGSYSLLSGPGNILSLKFLINIYIDGAAHPGTHSRTVTYDLEAGADISLYQLFRPGSDYLQALSNYCLAQLTITIPDLSMAGVLGTTENYRSWNITPDGLLITFDEYQVAAYALGPQQVVVPYAELQAIIDPHGALGGFLP